MQIRNPQPKINYLTRSAVAQGQPRMSKAPASQ